MQIDVRQERRNYPALGGSRRRALKASLRHHPRVQPLADQADHHPVDYPLAKQNLELPPVERVEKVRHICVQHPAATHVPQRIAKCGVRALGRAAGAKPVREIIEIFLVDGLQLHHHRTLEHFVSKRGDPDGTGLSSALWDLDSSDRWGPIGPGFSPVEQVLEIHGQIRREVGCTAAVDSWRSVLASAPVRFAHPLQIHVVGQRAQRCPRHLFCQSCYPCLFR